MQSKIDSFLWVTIPLQEAYGYHFLEKEGIKSVDLYCRVKNTYYLSKNCGRFWTAAPDC